MKPATFRALRHLQDGHPLYVFVHRGCGSRKGLHFYQEGNTLAHATFADLLDHGMLRLVAERKPEDKDHKLMETNSYATHYGRYDKTFFDKVKIYEMNVVNE